MITHIVRSFVAGKTQLSAHENLSAAQAELWRRTKHANQKHVVVIAVKAVQVALDKSGAPITAYQETELVEMRREKLKRRHHANEEMVAL